MRFALSTTDALENGDTEYVILMPRMLHWFFRFGILLILFGVAIATVPSYTGTPDTLVTLGFAFAYIGLFGPTVIEALKFSSTFTDHPDPTDPDGGDS